MIRLSDHFTYRKLLRFVFPSIVMMVFTSVYGVVDGLFVSNFVGKTAFAAINLVMPFVTVAGAAGFMLGTGGSALVAMTLGEQKREQANEYFSMMITVTLIAGIAVSLAGMLIMRPVAVWLGADAAMLPDCVLYGRISLGFTFTFMLQVAFQDFLITAGKPRLGLYVTVAAGVTNMVLDLLFVGIFRMGVAGAAVATGLSQSVGGLLPFLYFLRPNDSLLRLKRTRLKARPVLKACANGSSEMVSNMTASVTGMLYNFQLLRYAGRNGVAAYGVIMYVEFVFLAIFIGYSTGSAPIVGYHYGAGNTAELSNMLRKSLVLMSGGGIAMMAAALLLASPLSAFFVGYDAELLAMTVRAFRISSAAFLMAGVNLFASSFFTALNNGAVSAAISFLRMFLFKCSAVLLLPRVLAVDGIWLADVAAETGAFLVSAAFLIAFRKRYRY